MTVLLVLLRFIAEMYAVFGVLFFLLTLPNPFARTPDAQNMSGPSHE